MHTGQRIKSIRSKHLLTQKDFADRIGISPNYISELEAGKAKPSKLVLIYILGHSTLKKLMSLNGRSGSVELENKLITEEKEILSMLRKNRELYQTVKNLSNQYIKNKKILQNLSNKINISKEQVLLLLTTVDKIKSRSKTF